MQIFKGVILRLLVALLLIGSMLPVFQMGKATADGGAIIANHDVVDKYDDIPQIYIDAVKKMYLNVPGESHSAAYRKGLELLMSQNSTYQVINTVDDPPAASDNQALRVNRWVYNNGRYNNGLLTGEQEWYTWHAWNNPADTNYPAANATLIKNHITYCHDHGIEISAIGFGWCWDMTSSNVPEDAPSSSDNINGVLFRWAGASVGGPGPDGNGNTWNRKWGLDDADYALTLNHVNMDDYIQATEEYISYANLNSPNTRVFFTTGPVDADLIATSKCPENSESGYQREVKQQYIRDHFDDVYPNAALFDYADILTYSDDDTDQYTNTWNGTTYPQIHPDNMGGTGTGHIGAVGALRLGKALWWLLARMAGWDGNPESHISVTITDNGADGLNFGNHSPGTAKQPEAASPSITITNETTGNVAVYLMGTDFTGAAGTFSVTNAFYNESNNSSTALTMSTSYNTTAWKTLAPGAHLDIYHWLTIPGGTPAGSYSSDFTYKAQ
jgi:hypothetical protein